MRRRVPWRLMVTLAGAASGGACAAPLDTTRPAWEGSVGEAIYASLCGRLAASCHPEDASGALTRAACSAGAPMPDAAAPALHALHAERPRLLAVVDGVLAPHLAADLEALLRAMLPLYDSGLVPAHMAALDAALAAWEADPAALEALAARPAGRAPLWHVARAALDVVAPTGRTLQRTLGLVAPHGSMAAPNGGGARRDGSGAAPNGGDLRHDGNGAAPNGGDSGHDGSGAAPNGGDPGHDGSSAAPNGGGAGHDDSGAAPDRNTAVDATPEGAFAQRAALDSGAVRPDGRPSLVAPLPALIGAMGQPMAPVAVQALRLLWQQSPDAVLDAAALAVWVAQRPPPREAPRATAFFSNALAWGMDVAAVPELFGAVAAALQAPAAAGLGPDLARQLRHSDEVDFDSRDVNGRVGTLMTPVLPELPDTGGNRSAFARLLHLVHDARQPMLSRANAELGAAAPGDIFVIDDAALFYLRAIDGSAHLTLRLRRDNAFAMATADALCDEEPDARGAAGMAALTGIDGFGAAMPVPEPTPPECASTHVCLQVPVSAAAAARLLFATYDPRVAADSSFGVQRAAVLQCLVQEPTAAGMPLSSRHRGTLFVWEDRDFLAHVRPLVHAFLAHDSGVLLLDLLDLLHRHWASAAGAAALGPDSASAGTGLVAVAPLLADALDAGHALPVVAALGQAFAALQAQLAAGAVPAVRVDTALESGDATTSLDGSDAARTATPVDGSDAARTTTPVDGSGAAYTTAHTDASDAARALTAVDGPFRLIWARTPGAHQAVDLLLAALQAQLAADAATGSLAARAASVQAAATELLQAAGPAAALRALTAQARGADAAAVADVAAAVTRLLAAHPAAVADGIVAATAAALDPSLRPLWRASAAAVQGDGALLAQTVRLVAAIAEVDPHRVLERLAGALLADDGHGSTPLGTLLEIYGRVVVTGGGARPWQAADHGVSIGAIRRFLADEDRGAPRLLRVIAGRHG